MNYLLFFLNPFISGIYSLINFKKKHALSCLYLWFIIFGIGFVAQNRAADSYRYVQNFYEQSLSWDQYKAEILEYFTFDSNTKDIYVISVNFLIKHFTENYHWMFFIFAIVFGFFYTKSLKYLIPHLSYSIFSYILLFLFCFSNPIFNINGVRFWSAAWIGIYAFLKIIIDKKYYYYLLLAVTPLIHGSFFIWFFIVVFANIVPKIRHIWVIIYTLSITVSLSSQLSRLYSFSDYLPSFLANMIKYYSENEDILEYYSYSSQPLYAQILNTLPSIILIVLTYIVIFKIKDKENVDKNYYLIDVYLVLASFINFSSAIPTLGVRFIKLTMPILAIILAKSKKQLEGAYPILYFVPVAFSYSVYYWLKNIISVTELDLYILPAPFTIVKYLF